MKFMFGNTTLMEQGEGVEGLICEKLSRYKFSGMSKTRQKLMFCIPLPLQAV